MRDLEQLRAYYRTLLPFYDDSLADRGDLPFWAKVARDWGARGLLELGCGTGRVTAALCREAPVVAVDALMELLGRASRRAPAARLVAADLRRFSFASRFDLIVLADDPMAHLTETADREKALMLIAEHLVPGGRLVLEGLYRSLHGQPVEPASRSFGSGSTVVTVQETWRQRSSSIWEATYRYDDGASIAVAASTVRAWTRNETESLPELGLRIEALWGGFEEEPFGDDSPRIVIVARKDHSVRS